MLPKSSRLPLESFLAKRGASLRNTFIILKVYRPETEKTRLGVAIGKSVSKKAVTRNRIRRIIFQAYEKHREQFPHADILIIGLRPLESLSREKITGAVLDLIQKFPRHL